MVKSYLPVKFYSAEPFSSILEAEAEQSEIFLDNIQDLLNQFFVQTATWGLDYWETYAGIKKQVSQTYEQRREVILAKLRGAGMCTLAKLKEVANSFLGGENIVIEEDYANYIVKIDFIGTHPENWTKFLAAIEEIKPAHIMINYEFPYNLWQKFVDEDWNCGELMAYTVNDVLNNKNINKALTMQQIENYTIEDLEQFLK